jgi:hypothetical protein
LKFSPYFDDIYIEGKYMFTDRTGVIAGRKATNSLCPTSKTRIYGRFKGLLNEASTLKTSVSFYGNIIHNVDELSKVIASRELDINEDTLHIFEKAIKDNNALAAVDHQNELELEKLLLGGFSIYPQQRKLSEFLASDDPSLSLVILREFGAAKRTYNSPMSLFRPSGRINDTKDVHDLTESWFGESIRNALKLGIVLKINYSDVNRTEDLARAIRINQLAEDGQTFMLFKKAFENTILYAGINPFILYTLDLGYAVVSELKSNVDSNDLNKTLNLNNTLIDDIIDEKNSSAVNNFFVRYHVINLKYRS